MYMRVHVGMDVCVHERERERAYPYMLFPVNVLADVSLNMRACVVDMGRVTCEHE
jgi:hypothetical protein